MGKKFVYFFGGGKAEGSAKEKNLLGGKGANLAEMTNLGIPVPPGFSISTEVCRLYSPEASQTYPPGLKEEVEENLKKLEEVMGAKLGDPENPLLVSIRSGARVSMPGMMDTILNLGLNDATLKGLIKETKNGRFAYDCYRRFVQMYGDVVLGLKPESKDEEDPFEVLISAKKREKGVKQDTELEAEDLKELVLEFKREIKAKLGKDFPEDPWEQLWGAIGAVFGSWNNPRAIAYRKLNSIPGDWGTAVNVQVMVFGNMGSNSGTGVAFTRDPANGENRFYGEYLLNAQGEDVVAGTRTPHPINIAQKGEGKLISLEEEMPEIRYSLSGYAGY
jgi:pyruvate,orthophosphate dikinase